jgi:uncharacterized OB-fold protein
MTVHAKPLPRVTALTRPFWDGCSVGVLRLQRCLSCRKAVFYPRVCCPHCGHGGLEWFDASGSGAVITWTVVHRPGHDSFMADVPYVFAAVALAEGPTMYGRLHEPHDASGLIGRRVQVVFDALTHDIALPAFRLSSEHQAR